MKRTQTLTVTLTLTLAITLTLTIAVTLILQICTYMIVLVVGQSLSKSHSFTIIIILYAGWAHTIFPPLLTYNLYY